MIVEESNITYEIPRVDTEDWSIISIKPMPWNYTWKYFDGSRVEMQGSPGFRVRIDLRRVPHYFVLNLIVPVAVVSWVGFLSVLLPANSSDKLSLAITVLLGFLFIQTIIAELIPKSASIPLISYYVLFSLIFSAYNVSATALILYIFHRGDNQFPFPAFLSVLGIYFLGILVFHRVKANWTALFAKLERAPSIVDVAADAEYSRVNQENNADRIQTVQTAEQILNNSAHSRNEPCECSWHEFASHLNLLFSAIYFFGCIAVFSVFLLPLVHTACHEGGC